jgi:23S rRNA pseudouridine1911/1915/1917 synthase
MPTNNIEPLPEGRILFLDHQVMAVYKNAGDPVQSDQTGDVPLLEQARAFIQQKFNKPGNVFCGLIHRIDRPVSGVLLLARTSKALARMNEAFKLRETRKIYHVLVRHTEVPDEGTLEHFLKRNPTNNTSKVVSSKTLGAQEARLHFTKRFTGTHLSLLEIHLETGRHHQIRAQLAAMGWPIYGDVKYGDRRPLEDKSIGLHAFRLDFCHPTTKELISIEAPYPERPWWNSFRQQK